MSDEDGYKAGRKLQISTEDSDSDIAVLSDFSDDSSISSIRDGAKHLAPPLTHIINLSLHSGKVPDELKSARGLPNMQKKNTVRLTLEITDQYQPYALFQKYLRE